MKLRSLLEINRPIDFQSAILAYVNNNDPNELYKVYTQIPSTLKFTGSAYHIFPVTGPELTFFLKEGKFVYKINKSILSWSKTMAGLTEAYYNLSTDNPSKFKHALILKTRLSPSNVIVDITKFAKQYPNGISSTQYADYIREEEVVTVNFLKGTIINGLVDGYIINHEPKKYENTYNHTQ